MNKNFYNSLYLGVIVLMLLISCGPASTPTQKPSKENGGNGATTSSSEEPPGDGTENSKGNATASPSSQSKSDVNFDLSTAKSTPPVDVDAIIDEVAFYGMGGGSGDEDPCEGVTTPTIISEWYEIEQMQSAWVMMCGWDENANVMTTLTRPDNSSETEELDVSYQPVYWAYMPDVSDPIGDYKVEFSDGNRFIGFKFVVNPVEESGVMIIYNDSLIRVYKFKPQENLRLFNYEYEDRTLRLQNWQEFVTDGQGNLRIHLDEITGYYVVVGERTGEFPLSEGFGQSILKSNAPNASNKSLCDGAPKSKVAVGSAARVTYTDGTPSRVRAKPSTSSKILGEIADGTQFLIKQGPKCADGYTWWQVQLQNGTKGWMAEGSKAVYFIEPVSASQSSCKGMRTRISVGEQARAAFTDGSNMRIREKPGFSQDILDKVPEGTIIKVLDGPQCADGNNWWKIRTAKGLDGWMTESQNGVYLLEPVP